MTKSARNAQLDLSTGMLADSVEVSRQFLRSVRVDVDLGRADALDGYICQGTASSLLENMSRQILQSQQRAFTWTGPYGGGKSSLALALCSLVGRDAKIRARAKKVLDLRAGSPVGKAFAATGDGWLVVPVVGRREGVVGAISAALAKARGGRARVGRPREPIGELVAEATARPKQGVLLVIDELGKFLENAAQAGDDVHFYQELAEAASRCDGKLVVVGILHQAFEAYASRLGREVQEEWAKVQGRFIDIPLVAASDEVVELTARAISVVGNFDRSPAKVLASHVAHSIRKRRSGAPPGLDDALYRCWPLHPVTAALLGPVSRRKFGQNERSIFGFLTSREPLGFAEFLESAAVAWTSMYAPARFWDYLRANFEPAILASTDGHRWSLGVDAVARADSRGNAVHAEIAKAIALIEMFRTTSGVAASTEVVEACVPRVSRKEVAQVLSDLADWSIILYRKHLDAWGVFAGSDFDIAAATAKATGEIGEPDLQQVAELTDLTPIIAKRLYHETGSMRWFARGIIRASELKDFKARSPSASGGSGDLVLVLPNRSQTPTAARKLARSRSAELADAQVVLFGVPTEGERIVELALELAGLGRVYSTRPELEGDLVARRELDSRIAATRGDLEEELRGAFSGAAWFYRGESVKVESSRGLSWLASHIAEQVYPATPHFSSELLNRDNPSSSAAKARRELMYRMLAHVDQQALGYEGYPADAGLYYTLLKSTGLHRELPSGGWGFSDPDSANGKTLCTLWDATCRLVAKPGEVTSVSDVYALWRSPPYGVKNGVLPVLALAFYLAKRKNIAVYVDGVFASELSEVHVDQWISDGRRIGFRWIEVSTGNSEFLERLAPALSKAIRRAIIAEPLDVARGLVALTFAVPPLARRTTCISQRTQEVRALLLRASDPHKVLFVDLPTVLGTPPGDALAETILEFIAEISNAYSVMLREVESRLLKELDQSGLALEGLRARAEAVSGISGEFSLDAFTNRLRTYTGTVADIEGLVSLAVSKPSRDWVDRDIDTAIFKLCSWGREFRKVETLASVRDRPANRRTLAVMVGDGAGAVSIGDFDVAVADQSKVEKIASKLSVAAAGEEPALFLAALAEVAAAIIRSNRKD